MTADLAITVERIGSDLARGARASEGVERAAPLFRTVLRLLLRGEPVTLAAVAAAAGKDERDVAEAIDAFQPVERDESGRIVGMGITLNSTPHRFRVDGRDVYTWCALDTLVFPTLLGIRAEVESPCHETGTPVRVTVTPDGVTAVEPGSAVVSVVPIEHVRNIRTAFCDHVHFFRSAEAATAWLAAHDGGRILPVREAFALGRSFAAGLMA